MRDGCFLYRIKIPGEELARRGHEIQMSQRMGEWARSEADIIVGQRLALAPASAMWLMLSESPRRREGKLKLVYEVDDDLFSIDPRQNHFAHVFKAPGVRQNMADNMRLADLVTVSTPRLAEVAGRHNPNVVVLPNSPEPAILDTPTPIYRGTDHQPLTIGWQGSPTHHEDWRVALPAVAEVMRRHEHVRMRFLGTSYPDGLPARRVDFVMWTPDLAQHYKRQARFDIGVAPLTGTLFNEAKSELRFTEAASLGIPMVCSDCPAYRGVVEHGVTGFLARTPADWVRHLETLVLDAELRRTIGDQARAAARGWTIDQRVTLWEEAYERLLA